MRTKRPKGGYRRRPDPSQDRPPAVERTPFNPRINKQLRPILREIGTPDKTPFKPDPFQLEALERLAEADVIVSAPTGSGKTYIAVEAMAQVLAKGGRAWYASPLKALSNSKFHEFGERFGTDKVGLLTGDHKVNQDAALIVGTTEILRNQLYDAMSRGENLASDLVVMDEAHYLGDPDRGVVWEEVIIYLPPRVRLLLLSATVANARDLAKWLEFVRGNRCEAIISTERPVPLHPLFLFPDGELVSLSKGRELSPQVRNFVREKRERAPRGGRIQAPYGRILKTLNEADLLPAIFFLKSRADCDLALSRAFGQTDYLDANRRERLEKRLDELLDKYPFLKDHGHIKYIRGAGVAAHHAGHMPHWKLVVEALMQEGLLAAIFSTSTVAAGVNFPARTVVISQSDKFNGHDFVDLTTTDLLQMTGRAGRRGMDRIGFALVVPGPFQNAELIHDLFGAEPEPVISQIKIDFSMALNLLHSQRPGDIKRLLSMSLASYQQEHSRRASEAGRILARLEEVLAERACESPEGALMLYHRRRKLLDELVRIEKARPEAARERMLKLGLIPGRLFEVGEGRFFCFLAYKNRRGRPGVLAARLREDIGLKKGQPRAKWIPLEAVTGLLETVLDFRDDTPAEEGLQLIRSAAGQQHTLLDPADLVPGLKTDPLADLEGRKAATEKELESLPCERCSVFRDCLGRPDGEAYRLLNKLHRLQINSDSSSFLLWSSFLKHLEFLKAEGFVDENDELTADGEWAAQLRLDHPLLIAAGIRAGVWPEHNPALLAALVAPFVVDKDRDLDEEGPKKLLPRHLVNAWRQLEATVAPLIATLQDWGFPTPQLKMRPALAIFAWASWGDWDTAVRLYGLDQGDMAMLVFRTADNLRQIANLSETHPGLAPAARAAVDLILKEPVMVPL